jgi:putative transposase
MKQASAVHQVHNGHKYIATKDSCEAMADLKAIYQAASKKVRELHMDAFEDKWIKKNPVVVKS